MRGGGRASPSPHTGQEGFEPSWPVCGEVEAILNTIDHLEQPFHCNQHALIKEGRNVINNRGGMILSRICVFDLIIFIELHDTIDYRITKKRES